MDSFIIGVCFERTFAKSQGEFLNILQTISNLKDMVEAKFCDEIGLIEIYNRIAVNNLDIHEQYNLLRIQKKCQQETQQFYYPSGRSQQIQQNTEGKTQKNVQAIMSQPETQETQNFNKNTNLTQQVQQSSLEQTRDHQQSQLQEMIQQDITQESLQNLKNQDTSLVECKICLESSPINEMKVLNCDHIFHFVCLNKSCVIQIQERILPLCPSIECKIPIDESDLIQVLDGINLHQFQQLSLQKYIECHNDEYSCCPTPDCNYKFNLGNCSYFDCPQCNKIYCLHCKVDYHLGYTCEEYVQGIKNDKEKALDDQFYNFVLGSKFKQCPQCKFWVEKNKGCDHMTCRCKFEFCYVCGGVYKQCRCIK